MHSIRPICEENKTHLQSLNKLLTVLHPPPSPKLPPHNQKSEWRRKRRTGVWRGQERSARRSKSTEDDVVLCMAWCVMDMHLDFLHFLQRMILQRLTSCCLMAESSCSPPRGRPTSTSTSPPCSPSSSPPHSTQGEFWHQSEKENICHPNHFPLFTFIFFSWGNSIVL